VKVGDESPSDKACLATRQLFDNTGLKTMKNRKKLTVAFFEN